jgi:hypothetical protein
VLSYTSAGNVLFSGNCGNDTAMLDMSDTFIVSLQDIEKTTGYGFSYDLDKSAKPGASWGLDTVDGIPKWRS